MDQQRTVTVLTIAAVAALAVFFYMQRRGSPQWERMAATNIPAGVGLQNRVQVTGVADAKERAAKIDGCRSFVFLPGDPPYAWFKADSKDDAVTVADAKTDTYFRA